MSRRHTFVLVTCGKNSNQLNSCSKSQGEILSPQQSFLLVRIVGLVAWACNCDMFLGFDGSCFLTLKFSDGIEKVQTGLETNGRELAKV